MKGKIMNYRRGRKSITPKQMIIAFEEITTAAKAATLVSKKVVWTSSSGKEHVGKIIHTHGKKGAVRARFNIGLPGDSVGQKIVLVEPKTK